MFPVFRGILIDSPLCNKSISYFCGPDCRTIQRGIGTFRESYHDDLISLQSDVREIVSVIRIGFEEIEPTHDHSITTLMDLTRNIYEGMIFSHHLGKSGQVPCIYSLIESQSDRTWVTFQHTVLVSRFLN